MKKLIKLSLIGVGLLSGFIWANAVNAAPAPEQSAPAMTTAQATKLGTAAVTTHNGMQKVASSTDATQALPLAPPISIIGAAIKTPHASRDIAVITAHLSQASATQRGATAQQPIVGTAGANNFG